jgi:hypothetical protein
MDRRDPLAVNPYHASKAKLTTEFEGTVENLLISDRHRGDQPMLKFWPTKYTMI